VTETGEGCQRAPGIRADVPIRGGAYSLAVVTWWRTRNRRWAVLAALVGFVIVAVYLTVMNSEGNNDIVEVAPWTLAMLTPAVLSSIASVTKADRRARAMLLGAAALYLAIGVLSIFSLGAGFLAAGALALFAANDLPRSTRS
jgi:hypothetical protein